jgi:hypothetical protein
MAIPPGPNLHESFDFVTDILAANGVPHPMLLNDSAQSELPGKVPATASYGLSPLYHARLLPRTQAHLTQCLHQIMPAGSRGGYAPKWSFHRPSRGIGALIHGVASCSNRCIAGNAVGGSNPAATEITPLSGRLLSFLANEWGCLVLQWNEKPPPVSRPPAGRSFRSKRETHQY